MTIKEVEALTFKDDKNWRYGFWALAELGLLTMAVISALKEVGLL